MIKVTAFTLAMLLCVVFAGYALTNLVVTEYEPATDVTIGSSAPPTIQQEPTEESTFPSETQPTDEETVPAETEPEPEYLIGDVYIQTSTPLSSGYSEAQVRVEYPGGDIALQTVKIKHRGNSSLSAAKKSYNIKFSEKVSLFGMEEGKKWCFLADPFDKSLLRPTIGFEYAQALGIQYTSQTRLCRLWLDGTYMGVYTVVEPVDAGKNLVDIDEEKGDFLIERNFNTERTEEDVTYITTVYGMRFELNVPETPTAEQLEQITGTVTKIERAVRTLDHTQYEGYIDVASFVDFYIFHEVIKDVDFGHYSTRYYFKDGVLYAGPPWDLDLTMGNLTATHWEQLYKLYNNAGGYGDGSGDSAQGFWCDSKDFYRWLCQDEYFMGLVRQRWKDVKTVTDHLVKDNQLGQNRIDWYLTHVGQVLESNYSEAGWSVSKPDSAYEYHTPAQDYRGNVELLRQWLIRRIAWLDGKWAD